MGDDMIGHYSLICKKTDLFKNLVERLYNDFPQLRNKETLFSINTRTIDLSKTIEQNKIKENDKINLFFTLDEENK